MQASGRQRETRERESYFAQQSVLEASVFVAGGGKAETNELE